MCVIFDMRPSIQDEHFLGCRLVKDTSTCSHKKESLEAEKAGLDQVNKSPQLKY